MSIRLRSRSIRKTLIVLLIAAGTVALTSCGDGASSPLPSSASTTVSITTSSTATVTTGSTATTTSPPVTEEGGYVTVDVQTAFAALSADEGAQLVDVREPAEWQETGVPQGAQLIPLGELEQRAPSELAKDRPVYVICRSGNRSRTASAMLVSLGFEDVFNVDGGIKAWSSAGLPVEPYTP